MTNVPSAMSELDNPVHGKFKPADTLGRTRQSITFAGELRTLRRLGDTRVSCDQRSKDLGAANKSAICLINH